MSKITRLAVLVVGLMSLFGIMSATAGAVTWHNTGATTFTATSGAGTLSSTSAALNCGNATGTGTAAALFVGTTYAVSGTATFGSCFLSGITTTVDCGFTLTGTSQPVTRVSTTGSVDVTCDVSQFGTKLCHIEGSVHGTYTRTAGAGDGVLTLSTGGSLNTTNPPSGSCPLGNGDRAHLSELTFTTTSANPPVIHRTA
jgi:hypothetical protein